MSGTVVAQTEDLVVGEGVRISVEFYDIETLHLADPVQPVIVAVDPPPADPMPATRTVTATRVRRGVFIANVVADRAGVWTFRGESSGTGPGVVEGVFEVAPSRMR